MGLVATGAAFEAHRRMLEGEGSAFVAMAAEAAGFVRGKHRTHGGPRAAVWIVAVDAAHGAFGQAVMIGLLEGRPDIQMAAGTLFVDLDRLGPPKARAALGGNTF